MKTKLVKVNCVSEIDSNRKYVLKSFDHQWNTNPFEHPFSSVCTWVGQNKLYEVVEVNWWEDVPEDGLLLIRIDDSSHTELWTEKEIVDNNNVRKSWRPATLEDIEKLKELLQRG
ncbi:hypothetical protein [uncultured Mediterranean phage uvMED]|nr:hypothetical protein [uncultured Mediterranean phage uvMED]